MTLTVLILFQVQLLPTIYSTNTVTYSTAKLFAYIMAREIVLSRTPTIIIYESMVVHSQHLALIGQSCTNR